jgi:hypothetical protein
VTARDYLKQILYTKEEIDAWLSDKAFPFAYYHSDFGWLLNNGYIRDGMDNSYSVYTYAEDQGERIMSNYNEKPCRVNTYGNSFTQCHQVSDHETWQEVLAAHIQEPVRNYGIGGWSVYQAYLRMLKEEEINPGEYLIINIYQDDHRRNLDAWRNIRVRKHSRFIEPPLPHLKVDLKNRGVVECPNPCPTRESLYTLCDPDKTYELFKDDFILKIMVSHANSKTKKPLNRYKEIMELTKTHGIETRIETNEKLVEISEALHIKASLFASEWLVEKFDEYAAEHNKKIIYVLSYPARSIAQYLDEGTRWDQPFVDFLQNRKAIVVDLAEEHVMDFSKYKIGTKEYIEQYFIGHYNPRGNFFCAFCIKDKLVSLLDPKPIPYNH